jgi:class 3 adenylate cyclase
MSACPHCGAENPGGFRFCGDCGQRLDPPPSRRERRLVSVLFADLVGFTRHAEQLDIEDVERMLAPYH